MVPARSDKVSRVSSYSGYRHVNLPFTYGAFTLYGLLSQNSSVRFVESIIRSEPRNARTPVWPLSISLAATLEIDVSFSSSGYLDVSVHRVPSVALCIHATVIRLLVPGFPIRISMDQSLLTAPHGFSQLTTSFFGSWCQGIHPMLLLA